MSDEKEPQDQSPQNDSNELSAATAQQPEVIEGIPEEVQEALEKLPPELRAQFTFFASQQRIGVPVVNPIANKVTAAHIDKLLDNAEEDAKRGHTEWKWDKLSGVVYCLVFVALFVFLIMFLIDRKPEYILELIKYAAVFAGGFGLKSYLDKRKDAD